MRQRLRKSRRVAKRHLLGRDEQLQHIIPGKPIEDPSAFPARIHQSGCFEALEIIRGCGYRHAAEFGEPVHAGFALREDFQQLQPAAVDKGFEEVRESIKDFAPLLLSTIT